MKLIVGLGNPGEEHIHNRHNAGWLAIDHFAAANDLKFSPDDRSQSAKLTKAGTGLEAVLLKPQTFMNSSGRAVGPVVDFYKLKAADVLVIYDDIDLEFGKLRIRKDGSSGGHRGIESIINAIGKDFYRVRIGTSSTQRHKLGARDFVLANFSKSEQVRLKNIFDYITVIIEKFIKEIELEPHTKVFQ